jgi:hypothetical protein
MRKAVYALLLLGSVSILLSADSFQGKWKLNQNKSKFTSGALPQAETMALEDQGYNVNVTIAGTAVDGTPIAVSYVVPAAGGPGQITQGASYDGVSSSNVDANTRDTTVMKNGKPVGVVHAIVSPDGQVMTLVVKGADTTGMPADGTLVLDRQP